MVDVQESIVRAAFSAALVAAPGQYFTANPGWNCAAVALARFMHHGIAVGSFCFIPVHFHFAIYRLDIEFCAGRVFVYVDLISRTVCPPGGSFVSPVSNAGYQRFISRHLFLEKI